MRHSISNIATIASMPVMVSESMDWEFSLFASGSELWALKRAKIRITPVIIDPMANYVTACEAASVTNASVETGRVAAIVSLVENA